MMKIQVGKMYRSKDGRLCFIFHKWRNIPTNDPFLGAQIAPQRYEGLPYRQMSFSETGKAFIDSPASDLVEEVECYFSENKYDNEETKALKLIANLHMSNNTVLSSMVVPLVHGIVQKKPTLRDKAVYSKRWLKGYLIGFVFGWLVVGVSWFLPRLFL